MGMTQLPHRVIRNEAEMRCMRELLHANTVKVPTCQLMLGFRQREEGVPTCPALAAEVMGVACFP